VFDDLVDDLSHVLLLMRLLGGPVIGRLALGANRTKLRGRLPPRGLISR
jgi:hypothetical protein